MYKTNLITELTLELREMENISDEKIRELHGCSKNDAVSGIKAYIKSYKSERAHSLCPNQWE
ncbi:hypothetical protein [Massilibacteroides vaginae]|uniref:hypothetical protein n=1 Tax=Massilibacteroides vaginae TaxID=1673718 RepID=UPI000A1CEF9A|nr:hypothetical protein [Massilibacteroides vaginae]